MATKYPKTAPEQTAWDTLTRLEENLKSLDQATRAFQLAETVQLRGQRLVERFQAARDSVLGKLYEEIRDEFVELYRSLHADDEPNFTAALKPEGAGLSLEVEFFGRGMHPPHALHSEGHQDSMGLCLYLALAERLTGGVIDLLILDDVVMSVDAGHRRQVCRILKESYPHRQFLITTHDRTWANQLRSEGVVTARGMVEFYNWHVASGPQVNDEADMWKKIEGDLIKNDVPTAAARLRRGAEEFFAAVDDGLAARVPYRLNCRYELGDFLPAAMAQYRELLKQAKRSANSWGDKAKVETFAELESTSNQVFERSKAEQWAVNANVHYNSWINFSREDFEVVIEVFQDLYRVFECNACGGKIYLLLKEKAVEAVRCGCASMTWNLNEKPAGAGKAGGSASGA